MKPAMPYLDVFLAAAKRVRCAHWPYQVSANTPCSRPPLKRAGSIVTAPSSSRWFGIRRAGADFIATYFAKDAAMALIALELLAKSFKSTYQ